MFTNIGSKIKKLAQFLCVFGIVVSYLWGLSVIISSYNLLMSDESVSKVGIVFGILIILLGSAISWISSFTLYGFGELIEQVTTLNYSIENFKDLLSYQHNESMRIIKINMLKSQNLISDDEYRKEMTADIYDNQN